MLFVALGGILNRIIITLLFLIFATNAYACLVPIRSPEFDKLIKITWDREQYNFLIAFPEKADGQLFQNLTLNISGKDKDFPGTSADLKTYSKDGKVFAYIRSLETLENNLSVSVWWQSEHDLCAIIGQVELIKS